MAGANLPNGVLLANVLTHTHEGKVHVRLLNATDKTVRLLPQIRLAEICKPLEVHLKEPITIEVEDNALHIQVLNKVETGVTKVKADVLPVSIGVNLEGVVGRAQGCILQD